MKSYTFWITWDRIDLDLWDSRMDKWINENGMPHQIKKWLLWLAIKVNQSLLTISHYSSFQSKGRSFYLLWAWHESLWILPPWRSSWDPVRLKDLTFLLLSSIKSLAETIVPRYTSNLILKSIKNLITSAEARSASLPHDPDDIRCWTSTKFPQLVCHEGQPKTFNQDRRD